MVVGAVQQRGKRKSLGEEDVVDVKRFKLSRGSLQITQVPKSINGVGDVHRLRSIRITPGTREVEMEEKKNKEEEAEDEEDGEGERVGSGEEDEENEYFVFDICQV